jgi:LacI family transcriptional regulator
VYFELIRGAERVAAGAGSTLILAESQESPELERASVEKLQPAVDGVVLVGSRLSDDDIQGLSEAKPLILVNRTVDGIPAVIPDIEPGVTELLDHLQSLGHRSIGYLSGPPASWINRLRWTTLFDRAVERGLSIVELGPSAPTREGGGAILPRIRAAAVTAVVAYNDLIAMGLLRACRDTGIRVPEDLSIIGFDDIFGADLTSPALTTVRSPMRELGEGAIRKLLADINGQAIDNGLKLTTELIVRESTAPKV